MNDPMVEFREPIIDGHIANRRGRSRIVEAENHLRSGNNTLAAQEYRDAAICFLRAAHEAARTASWIDHDADLAGYTDKALDDCISLLEDGE